jgi:acid stress chaperone HdeB
MKHTKSILVGLLLALSAAMPAQAQVTMDVAKITCEQFLLWKVSDPNKIAIWLSGYFNGKKGNTVIDVKQLEEHANQLTAKCRADYKSTVLNAAEAIVAGK